MEEGKLNNRCYIYLYCIPGFALICKGKFLEHMLEVFTLPGNSWISCSTDANISLTWATWITLESKSQHPSHRVSDQSWHYLLICICGGKFLDRMPEVLLPDVDLTMLRSTEANISMTRVSTTPCMWSVYCSIFSCVSADTDDKSPATVSLTTASMAFVWSSKQFNRQFNGQFNRQFNRQFNYTNMLKSWMNYV